jgi:hypothetical protein
MTCGLGPTPSCPQSAAVFYALQKYGAFFGDLQDTTKPLTFRFAQTTSGGNSWSSTDLANLNKITLANMELIQRGTIHCHSGSC